MGGHPLEVDPMPLVYRYNIPSASRQAPIETEALPETDPVNPHDAIDWRPRILYRPPNSCAKTRSEIESPKTQPLGLLNPQEIPMAAKKAKAKKTSPKTVKAKGSTGAAKPGVIATIIETISREKGATADECLAILVTKFPDRKPESMIKTVRIQANKNCSSKERDEKRGIVYFKRR
jgi:hypothetical protein